MSRLCQRQTLDTGSGTSETPFNVGVSLRSVGTNRLWTASAPGRCAALIRQGPARGVARVDDACQNSAKGLSRA